VLEKTSNFRRPQAELKTKSDLGLMRRAGQLAAQVLTELKPHVQAGVTTKELDRIAEKFIRKNGGVPTFIGYRGYPATLCVSINEEVVHGIPGGRKLEQGNLVSIDVAATVDGFVGDTATTYVVGDYPSAKAKRLVEVTKASLLKAIDAMRPGNRLGDVSFAVQEFVEKNGFGVVRDFVGHGIGRKMHEEPPVPNYGQPGTGIKLETGLVLAIEPMVTEGHWQVKVLSDGWTVVTADGLLASHEEHTVALTENGPEILTTV